MDIPTGAPPGVRTSPREPAATVVADGGGSGRTVSAVSWAAVFAGAVAAGATGLILLALGAGLGLASVSPVSFGNPSPTTLTAAMAIWLVVVHWIASAMGGYMSGRLRTKWVALHTDEVFFRDTAHGFLAWALATVVMAGVGATTIAAGLEAAKGGAGETRAYAVDALFRPAPGQSPSAGTSSAGLATTQARAEATRILAVDLAKGDVPPDDRQYLAGLAATHTGISPEDAQKRVDTGIATMRDTANQVRKAGASLSIVLALAMVIGAFVACVAAALGGRRRDLHA